MGQPECQYHVDRLSRRLRIAWLVGCAILAAGCHQRAPARFSDQSLPCQSVLDRIDYPQLCDQACEQTGHLYTGPPPTVRNYEQLEPWPLTLEEAVHAALQNSEVLQKLGGRVVTAPQGTATVFDPAIQESSPQSSVEAALSAFDAQLASRLFVNHSERKFNNFFVGAGADQLISQTGNFVLDLSKRTAAGTEVSLRNLTDYNRNNSPVNRFPSVWDTVMQLEVRQPLLRGAGVAVNRIAGPNSPPGVYNGVLIARIRNDVSLADFEAAVRDLVRDVETTYWDLFNAYYNLSALVQARDAARVAWENRSVREGAGLERREEEALARQQYFSFQTQVENALSGRLAGQLGVFDSERRLRRLLGLPTADGRLIRPSTDPTVAPVIFDWDQSQNVALQRRVELRRQKWIVRQRELELCAAKQLNKWQLDFVGQYGWRGFGENLFGHANEPEGSAFSDLLQGDLDDWQLGFELNGPIGNRAGYLAVRNAQLQLVREKTLLREQQRQILLDLADAYADVERAFANIRSSFNNHNAVIDELIDKSRRAEGGLENLFLLLNAQQRAATSSISFYRSIADYNISLMNFAYESGSLLSQYNIYLAEQGWCVPAEQNALDNASHFRFYPGRAASTDVQPLSRGPYNQQSDLHPQIRQLPAPPEPESGM